jgi:hypothetical protein
MERHYLRSDHERHISTQRPRHDMHRSQFGCGREAASCNPWHAFKKSFKKSIDLQDCIMERF